MRNFRIEITGPGRGKIFIDDVEIGGVRAVSFSSRVNEANVVHLEVFAATLNFVGPSALVATEVEKPRLAEGVVDVTAINSAAQTSERG